MSTQLERIAEAVAFAHDDDTALHALADTPEAREFERVAALVAAACAPTDPPPAALQDRLAADALRYCAATPPNASTGFTTPRPAPRRPLLAFVAGALAASLCVWLFLQQSHDASLQQLRDELLANAQDIAQRAWDRGPSPMAGQVTGDVIWSQDRQEGLMRLQHLPVLPPDKAYQLWIFDAERPTHPIDGGVFRIESADVETLVRIDAKLPVQKPTMFAVTVEDRRGVVVSAKEHIVALATL